MIDSSPRREEITRPCTKTWSPRSTNSFQRARDSSPTSASETMAWMREPSPDCRDAKQSLPVLRENTMRPAMPTTSWVSSPVSRWAYCSRTAGIVVVIGSSAGRRRSRRRGASSACRAGPVAARWSPRRTGLLRRSLRSLLVRLRWGRGGRSDGTRRFALGRALVGAGGRTSARAAARRGGWPHGGVGGARPRQGPGAPRPTKLSRDGAPSGRSRQVMTTSRPGTSAHTVASPDRRLRSPSWSPFTT